MNDILTLMRKHNIGMPLLALVTVVTDKPPTLKEAQAAVGGWVELVDLENGDQLLCNEEGLLHELPVNPLASVLAGTTIVGQTMLLRGKARWE